MRSLERVVCVASEALRLPGMEGLQDRRRRRGPVFSIHQKADCLADLLQVWVDQHTLDLDIT